MKNKKLVSTYIKFKESIFNDMNARSKVFLASEYDHLSNDHGIWFIDKKEEEEIFIPWHNIVVMQVKVEISSEAEP